VESPPGTTQVKIRVGLTVVRAIWFQTGAILEAIQSAYKGARVGEISTRRKVIRGGGDSGRRLDEDCERMALSCFQSSDGARYIAALAISSSVGQI